MGNALGGPTARAPRRRQPDALVLLRERPRRGLLLVGLDRRNDGEIFNIGNPSEITIRGLAERIRDLVDPDLPIVSIDARVGDPGSSSPGHLEDPGALRLGADGGPREGLAPTIEAYADEAIGVVA